MVDLGMVGSIAVFAARAASTSSSRSRPRAARRAPLRARRQAARRLARRRAPGQRHVQRARAAARPRRSRRPARAEHGERRARRRQERDLRRLRQGRRRQVDGHRQPGRRAAVEGKQAAALDADVWGYSIPRMLGVHGRPRVSAARKILPLEAADGIKAVSIEHFIEGRDQAITWRGPMLHKAIRQFLEDVDWGELDYLLIDLPPGTGDVSMTLAQLLPQARFVIVTTPQPAAQKVAAARRRHGAALRPRDRGRGREHVRASSRRAASASRSSARAAASSWPTSWTCRCWARSAPGGAAPGADEGRPLVLTDPDAPASQAIFHRARADGAGRRARPRPSRSGRRAQSPGHGTADGARRCGKPAPHAASDGLAATRPA